MAPFVVLLALFAFSKPAPSWAAPPSPDTVAVSSGALRLHGLLWTPSGRPPFTAVLFLHGSGAPNDTEEGREAKRLRERQASVLGPVFAKHGYVFFYLYRRGAGLSEDQGGYSGDLMEREKALHGQAGRNRKQIELLETSELQDALAGVAYLRSLQVVDPGRVAVAGTSFGGSLALITAEHDSTLRAVVDFAGAANSWRSSPELRARLLDAVRRTKVPISFLHAANDYSVTPGTTLAAEMARLGKDHRVRIYPPVGSTVQEGHSFVHLDVPAWERDVFEFLDARMSLPETERPPSH